MVGIHTFYPYSSLDSLSESEVGGVGESLGLVKKQNRETHTSFTLVGMES